jgi:hypothetical protein
LSREKRNNDGARDLHGDDDMKQGTNTVSFVLRIVTSTVAEIMSTEVVIILRSLFDQRLTQ